METKLVLDIVPTEEYGRSSEGAFLRAPDGAILFAYSRYDSKNWDDDAPCNIVMIRSYDEGETWSEPKIIADAAYFGVCNIMSVSKVIQSDNSLGFYFLIKENDGTSTIGRAVSKDGFNFEASRCQCNFVNSYYVVNNDRIERLSDGRLVAPAAKLPRCPNNSSDCKNNWISVCLLSDDDGLSFYCAPPLIKLENKVNSGCGMQEPGIIELKNGTFWLWARTECGFQYECFSHDPMNSFTSPEPSVFTSPCSPMKISRNTDGVLYSVYNPIPNYNGRVTGASWGRTPIVIRKSMDDGLSFGPCNVIEDDENRGYCYPAMFFTNDESLLCAYCRGSADDGACLARLGINKIKLSDIT